MTLKHSLLPLSPFFFFFGVDHKAPTEFVSGRRPTLKQPILVATDWGSAGGGRNSRGPILSRPPTRIITGALLLMILIAR